MTISCTYDKLGKIGPGTQIGFPFCIDDSLHAILKQIIDFNQQSITPGLLECNY